MRISLAYGKASLTLDLPDDIEIDIFSPPPVSQPVSKSRFLSEFESQGGVSALESNSLLFVVNDGYRHTPTATILKWLDEAYRGRLDNAHFLIATGTHAAPTEAHYQLIFGDLLDQLHDRISCHDCHDESSLEHVGVDHFNKPVFINKQFLGHERVIVIGSVEPHYFAGYTGGRKGIFPGLGDLATTERNHNLANSLDAQPLRLAGNPVHEHLLDILQLVDTSKVFSVQLVMDAGRNIIAAHCGSLSGSFERALADASKQYVRTSNQHYDAVLAELRPPLDGNLYQAQKALENTQAAVRDGGAVLLLSACEEGIGSQHFFNEAATWDTEANKPGDGILRFGSHKLSRVNHIRRRIDVGLHSSLDEDTVRAVFYEPVADPAAFFKARARENNNYRLAVVYDAGNTVLSIHGNPINNSTT